MQIPTSIRFLLACVIKANSKTSDKLAYCAWTFESAACGCIYHYFFCQMAGHRTGSSAVQDAAALR